MTVAAVNLWGRRIGAVSLQSPGDVAVFEYDADFADRAPVQVAPLMMPRRRAPYRFPGLSERSFRGLPGMLADSLPDRFGNALIDAWLAGQGRAPESFDAVERLCYIGSRGIGALEYVPAHGPEPVGGAIDIDALVQLASEVLTRRAGLDGSFAADRRDDALRDILSVGTSAGGARAKAVIAWNPETDEVRSGQVDHGAGFEHWLLKFDGVRANKDKELADPQGFGAIEYAYSLMAKDAGIDMSACRLLHEGDRRHFMTRRFDRLPDGSKVHMQSLAAIAHADFNAAGEYSYEQAMRVIRQLGMDVEAVRQQYRRAVFNVVARNQDDHVKNIAFLMDRDGRWRLSPAFDVNYAFQPDGQWTSRHQMSLAGKRDGFDADDLAACAHAALLSPAVARRIVDEVRAAVTRWPEHAAAAGVPAERAEGIAAAHRLDIGRVSRR